ncbi:MAG: outer membrane lipoprotein carrier protein LolA [Deltaproteobacteria bacterium]|jgi:outer membrane lipoprotein carrier protein|nr:outer membrane lipoprotein carrier protein LolA [Deltaproteobacteria bacterium]MBW2534538.1 outer membrane lipoprotein carrier protein LolA [Deltaproteobacteria bacterium]
MKPLQILPLALALLVGAATFTGTSSARADGPTAKQIATRVQTFYDSTRTFQARFKQTYRIKVQNVKKVSKGSVAFQKPGKLSFRYDQPNGNRVVSDGKKIKVYERDNQQMYVTKVRMSQYPAALAFLMGKGKLIQDFELRSLDSRRMKMEGGYVLECVPKEATPAYTKLLMYIDGPTSQVRRVLILDAQGNRNRFDFSSPVVNRTIPASEFRFTPPPGTSIVKP